MTLQPAILRGDARALPLADASVDLIVTSPPYFGLRSYQDGGEHYAEQIGAEPTPAEFIAALVECTREMVRALKPSGSIFLNLGDKYSTGNSGQSGMAKLDEKYRGGGHADVAAKQRSGRVQGMPPKSLLLLPERYRIACVDELGLIARAVIVWSKPNGLPESVTDRVRRSHEDWVHLTKSPKYFANVDTIREPVLHPDWSRPGLSTGASKEIRGVSETSALRNQAYKPNPIGKLPVSVWSVATQPLKVPVELGVNHHAAFPMEWPRRLIQGWCPEDGTVLDPFGGTGTTALVATMLGRRAITVDLSTDYCNKVAQWRINDPKEREKATKERWRPGPEPVVSPDLPSDIEYHRVIHALASAQTLDDINAVVAAVPPAHWLAVYEGPTQAALERLSTVGTPSEVTA